MSQQINLYEARLRPVRALVSARHTSAVFAVVLLAVLGGSVVARYSAQEKTVLLAEQRAALKIEQDKLAALARELAERKLSAAVQAELDQARAVLAARRETLAILDAGLLGGTAGFSPVMQGFSRLTSPDLWLTGFVLSHGGQDIEIRGRLLDASRLPAYVQRLSAEPAFQGRRFATLTMQSVEPAETAAGGGA